MYLLPLRDFVVFKVRVDLFATGELRFPVLEQSMGVIFCSDQLELRGVVSHPTWVRGFRCRPSGSTVTAVNHKDMSAASVPGFFT